jgi:hypothetical protein
MNYGFTMWQVPYMISRFFLDFPGISQNFKLLAEGIVVHARRVYNEEWS